LVERHVHLDRRVAGSSKPQFSPAASPSKSPNLPLGTIENFISRRSASMWQFPMARRNRHAARTHLRNFKTVGSQLLSDAPRKSRAASAKLDHQRNEHALSGELSVAARAQMLLEQHAFVRHVLVDDPQGLRRFTATMKLELTCPAASARSSFRRSPEVRRHTLSNVTDSRVVARKSCAIAEADSVRHRSDAALELESRRLRPQRRGAQFKIGRGCCARHH